MRRSHTSRCGHIGKVIAVVAVEQILPQLGRVQVLIAIVVKVRARRAHAPAAARGPERLAHIDKAGQAIVAKERMATALAIDPVQVLVAIAIVVERGCAAAFGLGDIALFQAAARVDAGQAELGGHIDEGRKRLGCDAARPQDGCAEATGYVWERRGQ